MHKAAIVPYGSDQKPENSLIYFSTDWAELVRLIQNPVVFMGAKGMINSPTSWTLRTDTTIIIAPFDSSDQSTLFFASLVAPLALEAAIVELKNKDHSLVDPLPPTSLPQLASITRNLMYGSHSDEVVDGGFVAEFALITGVLNILYVVPSQFVNPDKDEDLALTKFKGALTAATHIGQPLPDPLKTIGEFGNVHFDIEKDAARDQEKDRGALILDAIENPHRVFSRLGDHTCKKAVFGDVEEGANTLQFDAGQATIKPANYTFGPVRPTMVVEKASPAVAPDPCGVCVDGQTHQNADGSWSIRGVIYKCYMPPQ